MRILVSRGFIGPPTHSINCDSVDIPIAREKISGGKSTNKQMGLGTGKISAFLTMLYLREVVHVSMILPQGIFSSPIVPIFLSWTNRKEGKIDYVPKARPNLKRMYVFERGNYAPLLGLQLLSCPAKNNYSARFFIGFINDHDGTPLACGRDSSAICFRSSWNSFRALQQLFAREVMNLRKSR